MGLGLLGEGQAGDFGTGSASRACVACTFVKLLKSALKDDVCVVLEDDTSVVLGEDDASVVLLGGFRGGDSKSGCQRN